MQRTHRAIVSIIVLALAAGAAWFEQRNTLSPREKTGGVHDADASASAPVRASGFDYYLIALSWSPTYCESNPHDSEQCGRRGYGFVLHGLWPQYERGGGPQDCSSAQRPDRATIERSLAFMPSRRLIEHEWRAHGSCSGYEPAQYFALADRAYAKIQVPDALRASVRPPAMNADAISAAFVKANPGLRSNMLGVICSGHDLAEVRICVDNDLNPRACGNGVRTRCPRNTTLRIPLIR